jgi:sulfur carrier protein
MSLSVNGASAPLPSPATVGGLVATITEATRPRGIAVAVNGEVVPRSAWDATDLHPGDRVEVLTAAKGG